MEIGYIGLGLMGAPCVCNLLQAGHTVYIWARNPLATQPLVQKGAIACSSLYELAQKSRVVFTNVSNTSDVEEVLLGPAGVVHSGKKGLIIVDMSTISASATRTMAQTLAQQGMELVDAPVSGGTVGAEKGTLTFMVGASETTFAIIQPVLAAMGSTITRIGACGAGQVAKSCNQIIITGTIAAVAEAFRFAEKNETSLANIRTALLGGFAASRVLELHGQRMIDDTFAPGFKTTLHRKDLGIVKDIADEYGLQLPLTRMGYELLEQTILAGLGEADSSAMYKVVT